jgi:hypothetical protein
MNREQIIAKMNAIVAKAKGQFNSHLYKEYKFLEEMLEKLN